MVEGEYSKQRNSKAAHEKEGEEITDEESIAD